MTLKQRLYDPTGVFLFVRGEVVGMNAKTRTISHVSTLYQFFWVMVTVMGTGILLYNPVNRFSTTDTYPTLIPLTPQASIEFGGNPAEIKSGMYIRNFPEFDIVGGKFVIDATVWFKFNPRLVSLDRIGKFDVERVVQVKEKRGPFTRISGNELVAQYDILMDVRIPLNYSLFPLDDHRINFSVVNNFLLSTEGFFKSARDNLMVGNDVSVPGWNNVDKQVKTGYSVDKLEKNREENSISYHPKIIFSLDFQRAGIRNIISIIVPLLLIYFIALATFSFDVNGPNAGSIISVSIASITGTIGYRFVIESLAPSTGYFMISDYIFLYVLIACCIVFGANLIKGGITYRHKQLIIGVLSSAFLVLMAWVLSII